MSIVERPLADSASLLPRADGRAPSPDRLTPLTLAMYDRMIAAGVFDPAETHPLELIGGELHMMSPIGDRHADAVAFLTRWSSQCLDHGRMLVWVQNPLALPGSESAPQPDIAWVTFRRYADRRPLPEEVSLVIEVADTSLEFDTTVKAALYAAAGITDYWVVDLTTRGVIVFRDPRNGRYETRSTHRGDQPVSPLALPAASLSPAELFVPE
jgi:Uma2 family endonuclease